MSWEPQDQFVSRATNGIDVTVIPRASDIGGFTVQRALPSAALRMVGPFVFLDQMGPATLRAGDGLDVAPHPHIGLATVTYLFDGNIRHRDSLGVVQDICPGDVNWMTAGSGIVHSERTSATERAHERNLFGIQAWVALPKTHEETAPAFVHHSADELPVLEAEGKRVNLIAGDLYGAHAPVKTVSAMFYADVTLEAGAKLPVSVEHDERAIYIIDGAIDILPDAVTFETGRLLSFKRGIPVTVQAKTRVRFMLLGGEPMDDRRFVWWNFVSSSKERIEQAKSDWREGRFARVPDETESIPLPGEKPPPVNYP